MFQISPAVSTVKVVRIRSKAAKVKVTEPGFVDPLPAPMLPSEKNSAILPNRQRQRPCPPSDQQTHHVP
jgi:hypothetical protein